MIWSTKDQHFVRDFCSINSYDLSKVWNVLWHLGWNKLEYIFLRNENILWLWLIITNVYRYDWIQKRMKYLVLQRNINNFFFKFQHPLNFWLEVYVIELLLIHDYEVNIIFLFVMYNLHFFRSDLTIIWNFRKLKYLQDNNKI